MTDALKDGAGFIRSIFVKEAPVSSGGLSGALEDFYADYSGSFGLDEAGNPAGYRPLDFNELKAKIDFSVSRTAGDGISVIDLDGGVMDYVRLHPRTKQVLSTERVANLPARATFQNYFYDPHVGPYDLFPAANLQSGNPHLNSFLQGANDLNNVAALAFNLGSNAFGYVDSLIDRITGTTPEQRLALALQTQGPSPLFALDDLLARGEIAALKGIALLQSLTGAKNGLSVLRQATKLGREVKIVNQGSSISESALVNFVRWRADKTVLGEGTELYRVHARGRARGPWWLEDTPSSEIQWRIDAAVRPKWPGGQTSPAEKISVLRIPKGYALEGWKGLAASQGDAFVGGKSQIYIRNIPKAWIRTDDFEDWFLKEARRRKWGM